MLARALLIIVLVLALTGCASTKKEVSASEEQQLQARVSDLEAQLKQKDAEVQNLQVKLEKTQQQKVYIASKAVKEPAVVNLSQATPKQVQAALKNAGFYKGNIDGKIGQATKDAIKEFQKANGLNGDGVIGAKTWAKLKEFLN